MIILGLTGSIAMGKSTAVQMIRARGVLVHDSDTAVHHIYRHDQDFLNRIATRFPSCFSVIHQSIDRQKLADIIFNDPAARQDLEDLLHPKIRDSQMRFLQKCRRLHQKICVLDIPLLFETGAEERCDYVAVVSAPAAVQRRRALARPGMTAAKFEKILATQLSDAEKRARADFIISAALGRQKMQLKIVEILQVLQ